MSVLEIRRRTGAIETLELSKESPLTVGQMPTSDILVDADGVAPIHCRISWKHQGFEVTAASSDGVQFNGEMVHRSALSPGDVIRVGDVDIVLLAEPRKSTKERPRSGGDFDQRNQPADRLDLPSMSQAELRPLTDDSLPVRSFHLSDQLKAGRAEPPGGAPAAPEFSAPAERGGAAPQPPDPPARRAGMNRVAVDLDEMARHESSARAVDPPETAEAASLAAAAAKIREGLKGPRKRPGEQEAMRSPLVIGLSVGTLILALSALTIWFVLSRERAQKQFDLARQQLMTGQFEPAIEAFETFIREYPGHKLVPQARADIGTARVEQAIAGATPAWDKGLETLQKYIDDHREDQQFQNPESPVRQFVLQSADRIAAGALETARSQRQRALLGVSEQAVKVIELYSPAGAKPAERLAEIAKLARSAEEAILQQEAFDASVRKIDESLADKKPAAAFREYRHALERYAAAADYRPLKNRLKKASELERSLTVRVESVREAAQDRPAPPRQPLRRLTLARRTRESSDLTSVGTTVFAIAEDCLYAIDSVTSEPIWRRAIGLDPPFAPLVVSAGQPAVLTYDRSARELLLLVQRSGEVIWRLPMPAHPAGAPELYEGQIYLVTADAVLEQIDVQTGRSTARLKFAQPIASAPVVSQSGNRLYLPAHENVLYVLTRRPLGCEQIVWLGHGPGAIHTPPMMLRSYLLLAENDRQAQSTLRLLDTTREDQPPIAIARQRVEGQVVDAPVLRGKQLFVPSTPERVSAFDVAETGDNKALSPRGTYQVKNSRGSPVFVSAGPDDQMWMFSSSLRRIELTPDNLVPDKQQLATGIAAQPLQASGDSLFLGRRTPYSRAVLFSRAERRQMTTQWQLSLGAQILASVNSVAADGPTICLTDLGDLFQVTSQKLGRGGYDLQPIGQLPIPEGLTESLSAVRLEDGRLAAYCGGEQPRLWLPGADGIAREQKLPQALQTSPVRLGGGVLLALPGRLRLAGRAGNEAPVEDLPAPIGTGEPPRWLSLVALDDTQAVALSEAGRLARIRFGTAPVPHLEEITHWDAGSPVDLPLSRGGDHLFLVDTTSRLVMLAAASLEPEAHVVLEGSPAARPRPAGPVVVVELKTGRLAAYDIAAKLEKRWELPLDGGWLTGDPLFEKGRLLIALTDGRVVSVDVQTGQVIDKFEVGQQLSFGPQTWGANTVVGTLDGSIVVVAGKQPDPEPEPQPQPEKTPDEN